MKLMMERTDDDEEDETSDDEEKENDDEDYDNVGKWFITLPPTHIQLGVVNKAFQLIMKRIQLCDWLCIGKCIGDHGLDFVLDLLYACWLAAFAFVLLSFSFHFISNW